MESGNRRFVQFAHPGAEHAPDSDGRKEWNALSNPHRRKFLQLSGAWSDSGDPSRGAPQQGELWAWAEWEPESRLLKEFAPSDEGMPRYLWKPYWSHKPSYEGLHNTDPFIFDGFYYTDCRQNLDGLRNLDRGSVIVFGSKRWYGWVADTVLVVADFFDHTEQDFEQVLRGKVPACYWDVTLGPVYKAGRPRKPRRLYRGATFDAPVNGMFSFFPCSPAENAPFPRPALTLPPERFTQALAQGAKGHGRSGDSLDEATISGLWECIVEQVLEAGLLLGVRADTPAHM